MDRKETDEEDGVWNDLIGAVVVPWLLTYGKRFFEINLSLSKSFWNTITTLNKLNYHKH